jgi:hypothetical protein
MRRWIAVAWNASFLVLAAALYFLFVLPRWFELTGAWPVGLGTPMRIVCGVLVGLAALPVVFTLNHTRKPEFGTPKLALSLRIWSIVLLVLAGVLIVGTAIAEIWISLDKAGQWLFGIYGAAAAIAILGALGFQLAYVAEQAPPPPRPLKPKKQTTTRRGRGTADEVDDVDEADETPADDVESTEEADDVETTPAEDGTVILTKDSDGTPEDSETEPTDVEPSDTTDDEATGGKLRNRRPGGKRPGRFGRGRGGVAVDE